jgi:hypothetical protein
LNASSNLGGAFLSRPPENLYISATVICFGKKREHSLPANRYRAGVLYTRKFAPRVLLIPRLTALPMRSNTLLPISIDLHERAVELARDHNFSFYDALIVSAALGAGCSHLVTEDMQHGRILGGLQIENPFLIS